MQPTAPYRFAVLAHSSEIIESVRRVVCERDYTVRYCIIDFTTAIPKAQEYLEGDSEVVLCHGGTGSTILSAVGQSVVVIEHTEMDIIKCLRQACHLSKTIVLVTHINEHHDIGLMENLLDISIYPVTHDTDANLFSGIKRAYDAGFQVLVGGGVSKQYMESLGGTGFTIDPNPYSIQRALAHATAIARQKRLEAMRHMDMMVVFKHLDEGVVCVNNSSDPVFVNQKARSVLGLTENPSTETLSCFYDSLNLRYVLNDERPRYNRIVEIKGKQLTVTTLPLMTDDGTRGAVAIFQDSSSPSRQQLNNKAGENLYAKGFVTRSKLSDLRGESHSMVTLRQKIKRFASTEATVQISGETGTGKELVAHALHAASRRKDKAFVAVNFAALSPTLLESELFGHEEGAFTGARRCGKTGLFEMANGGTIFLDEIGEVSAEMQLRLLRVLEARELMRVGGDKILPVDVRVICASQVPLAHLVTEKKFRIDLYYRLSTLKVFVPPLRERLSDIPLLLERLLRQYNKPPQVISKNMLELMSTHHWPGNIRELLSLVESYLILLEGNCADDALFYPLLSDNHISLRTQERTQERYEDEFDPELPMKEHVDRIKTACARSAVKFYGGNRQRAAASLGLSYTTLWRLLEDRDK